MAKPEMEVQDIESIPWRLTMGGGDAPGIYEKILSKDPETGNITRLVKVEPGMETSETSSHDVWEEMWILKGGMIDKKKNLVFTEGMYGCRPPGMKHGPFSFPIGALILEFKYR
jgi:hypothetical protein